MYHTSFNQDSTCFVCGGEQGFVVYNCDPPVIRFGRLTEDDAEPSGIEIVEMLFRSNIFALVGGGKNPKYPRNKLMIWDDFQDKCIAELEFKSIVTGVKLRRSAILVSVVDKTYLYKFADLRLLATYNTAPNVDGVLALTVDQDLVIATPGIVVGSILVDNRDLGKQHVINAHSNPIAAIALSSDGKLVATASERGTLIRIWNTENAELVKELRRGLEVVTITSLTFDHDSTRIAVCSDKGTSHIFSLIKDPNTNKRSSLSYISGYLPSYFNSEWSSVSFEVPPNCICTFSNNSVDTVYFITPNNYLLKYVYDTNSGLGECVETTCFSS